MSVGGRALVIGAGGLGGPIALSLAAAGVAVEICDPDALELSNLHRQVAFTTADLGHGKAERLAATIVAGGGRARAHTARFAADTAGALLADVTLVVDGSDDPATKFLAADLARAAGLPHVIAAALGLGGNVFVGAPGAACYRCLFETVPDDAPSCADAGVLGPVVAWVGGVAAGHGLRLLAGDRAEAGSIWVLDHVATSPRTLHLTPRAGCACREA